MSERGATSLRAFGSRLEALSSPWLEERVLFDSDGLLVVDKPAGLPVHGGDDMLAGDVLRRLQQRCLALGQDPYLGVHQRLDQVTSGVLLLARDRAQNASLARAFDGHQLERWYVAAVTDPGLPERGRFEDRLEPQKGKPTRVVAQGGVAAVTDFRVLERGGGRALLELRPRTGRTHQLRAQLAHRQAPIAGDAAYGGAPAWRVMLHAAGLALPEVGCSFESPAPEEFAAWARGLAPALPGAVEQRLRDALSLRQPLLAVASAFRLVNDAGDGLPGVVVDYYDEWVALSLSSDEAEGRRSELVAALERQGARGVYVQRRLRADLRRLDADRIAPALPEAGEPAPKPLVVREYGRACEVWLGDGLSTGLFVDQRENRRRVAERAAGLRVLNLFSYTGAFTVAAATGGASRTVSVDLSRPALERTARALERNGQATRAHRQVEADAFEFLARPEVRRGFELVVLDPPSFATKRRGKTFSLSKDFRRLIALALGAVADGGQLLVVTNHRKTDPARLRRLAHGAARDAGRTLTSVRDGPAQVDCPPGPTGPFPSKSLWLAVARPAPYTLGRR
ncbi:MAG: class I SAM-dependent methyltransferase [Polyangiaceae bacterium]|nr:class I SAM-dependent methyltransferase [Polyangiaceae bacterium]